MNRKTSLLVLSVAIAGLLAACNRDETPDDGLMDDTAAVAPAATVPADTTPPGYDTGMPGDAMGVQTGPVTDTAFYALATQSNQKEIAAGKLAGEQAQDASVKDYARTLVADHTAMNQKVQEAAGNADAAAMAPDASATADLQGKSGPDFDRAYVDMMVMDHQKAVAMFENAAQNASTDQAKMLAQDALPKLREHLQRAQELQGQLGNLDP